MSFDTALMVFGVALDFTMTVIFFRSRIYRTLPVFAVWTVYCVLSDCWALQTLLRPGGLQSAAYFNMFRIETCLDSLVEFAVFIELAWSALRPFKALRPVPAVIGLTIISAALGLVLWPVAGLLPMLDLAPSYRSLYQLCYTISILRVTIFMLLAGFSQILAIGWRNRELQVATGLGFYSLVSVAATILHAYQNSLAAYHVIDLSTNISYQMSLVYWCFVFARSEAPRRKFSPEMQRVLLKVARASRVALESTPS